jgi:hypothetical protein
MGFTLTQVTLLILLLLLLLLLDWLLLLVVIAVGRMNQSAVWALVAKIHNFRFADLITKVFQKVLFMIQAKVLFESAGVSMIRNLGVAASAPHVSR